jgi:hypothetical protein
MQANGLSAFKWRLCARQALCCKVHECKLQRSSINGRGCSGESNRELLFGVGVDRFLLVGARETIKTGSNCRAKTKEANWRQLFSTAGSELTSARHRARAVFARRSLPSRSLGCVSAKSAHSYVFICARQVRERWNSLSHHYSARVMRQRWLHGDTRTHSLTHRQCCHVQEKAFSTNNNDVDCCSQL